MIRSTLALGVGLLVAACGGSEGPTPDAGEPPEASGAADASAATTPERPEGPLTIPDWFVVDAESGDVVLDITAGATPKQNHWNFNGYTSGEIVVTVPVDTRVTIDFRNADPVMAHSLGVSTETRSFAMAPAPSPAFPGAITENATSMMESTLPGESETISFVADEAGQYSLVCYIAGHTAVGMWLYFDVSEDGSIGVRGP